MKINVDDTIWAVVDAKKRSVLSDVIFKTNLFHLGRMHAGAAMVGDHEWSLNDNLTIYTDKQEAMIDAIERLKERDEK